TSPKADPSSITPQPVVPQRLPFPVPTPNPELAAPPVRYAHSCPTVCASGVPNATNELPAVTAADPEMLGRGVAGLGTELNPSFVSTLVCEFATLLFVIMTWNVLPVSEKSTVADIGEPSLSVPVPVKMRSALAGTAATAPITVTVHSHFELNLIMK